ncbi:MAG: class I SAM-dependent methyltransferase [Promethearchaeota archaeon]
MIVRRRDIPLLGFLSECNKTSLKKKILDCGAGGGSPPLAIFHEHGYECHGIEISKSRLKTAQNYAEQNKLNLNIILGDMCILPYENESFSFVFSHHTIHHMKKTDIKKSIEEMERVLVSEGLLFVNVPSVERSDYGQGEEVRKGEFVKRRRGKDSFHSYFEDDEADSYFQKTKIIHKMKWYLMKSEEWADGLVMLEYITRKK